MDVFEKYKSYYKDGVVRPQPGDFVRKYFKNKVGGFYIDVGAYDGITWSNSIDLDENLQWSGVCVEPIPSVYEKLKINRPQATCINAAASDNEEDVEFWHVTGYAEMLSGMTKDYDEDHVKRIHGDISNHGGEIKKINLKSITLASIIKGPVDYISIDVEGGELSVLKGLNISVNRPTLISIEDNGYTNEPMSFLEQNKYRKLGRVCGDIFYENSIL